MIEALIAVVIILSLSEYDRVQDQKKSVTMDQWTMTSCIND